MAKRTFLSPDQSQIELRICPRRTIKGRFLIVVLSLFLILCFHMALCSLLDDIRETVIYPFLFLIPLFLGLDIFILLPDDLLVLSSEGLFYRQKGFINKKRHFKLSSILSIKREIVEIFPSPRIEQELIKANMIDLKPLIIRNVWWISQKNKKIFIEECEEFLQRHKQISQAQTPEEKNTIELVNVINLKTDSQFNYDQPIDSEWTKDTTASEFTIFRKEKFSCLKILDCIPVIIGIFFFIGYCCHRLGDSISAVLCFIAIIGFAFAASLLFLNDLLNIIRCKRTRYLVFTRNEIRLKSPLMGMMQDYVYYVSRTEKLKIDPKGLSFIAVGKEEKEVTLYYLSLDSAAEARWLAAEYQRIYASGEN